MIRNVAKAAWPWDPYAIPKRFNRYVKILYVPRRSMRLDLHTASIIACDLERDDQLKSSDGK